MDENKLIYSIDNKKVTYDDFTLIKVLERNLGKLLKIEKNDNKKIFSMRIINMNKELKNINKQNYFQNFNYPFLITIHYVFEKPKRLFIIEDFMNAINLYNRLDEKIKLDEVEAKHYTTELCLALLHLHKQGITYKYLTSECIIIDKTGHIKINDYGIVKEIINENNEDNSFVECNNILFEYLSPELLKGEKYGNETDWWSLGILVYEMFTGRTPFLPDDDDEDMSKLFENIINEEPEFLPLMSFDVCDFIYKCLKKDPSQRIRDNMILTHSWFSDINWDDVLNKKGIPSYIPKFDEDGEYVNDDIYEQEHYDYPYESNVYSGNSYIWNDEQ